MDLLRDYWVALLPLLGVLWYMLTSVNPGTREYPYQRRDAFMTGNERDFYHALLRAAGDDYDIFGMVRIADLLTVAPGTQKRMTWQNRINGKHIDFVLCDRKNQEPLLAIEVDDRSHLRRDRQERDYFVDRAFDAASFPLLRVTATRRYSAKELKAAIAEELRGKPSRKLASERRVKLD